MNQIILVANMTTTHVYSGEIQSFALYFVIFDITRMIQVRDQKETSFAEAVNNSLVNVIVRKHLFDVFCLG
jgi:hypothetical protein